MSIRVRGRNLVFFSFPSSEMVHVTQPVSCRASVSPITSSHCHSLPVTASHCRKGKRFASTMENNAAMTASCSSMVLWKGTALLAPALACHRLPWFACRDNANDTYTMDILKHLDVAKGEVLEVQFAALVSRFFCLQLQYNIHIIHI